MFFLRAHISFKNTTHYTNVTNRQYLDCEAILILVLEIRLISFVFAGGTAASAYIIE